MGFALLSVFWCLMAIAHIYKGENLNGYMCIFIAHLSYGLGYLL